MSRYGQIELLVVVKGKRPSDGNGTDAFTSPECTCSRGASSYLSSGIFDNSAKNSSCFRSWIIIDEHLYKFHLRTRPHPLVFTDLKSKREAWKGPLTSSSSALSELSPEKRPHLQPHFSALLQPFRSPSRRITQVNKRIGFSRTKLRPSRATRN